jgi:hypothetical protein
LTKELKIYEAEAIQGSYPAWSFQHSFIFNKHLELIKTPLEVKSRCFKDNGFD